MIAIFSFIFSLLAIIGMISIKNWEMKAGKTIFAKTRFKFDIFVAKYLIILKSYTQTNNGRYFLKEIIHYAAYYISHIALSCARFAERKLIKIINFIKGRGVIEKKRQASPYLKNVADFDRHSDKK